MSIYLMSWAWQLPLPTSPKMVLLALADDANDDGVCWPSQKRIAIKSTMSRRTVQRNIGVLEDLGLISITSQYNTAGRTTNVYQISQISKTELAAKIDALSKTPSQTVSVKMTHGDKIDTQKTEHYDKTPSQAVGVKMTHTEEVCVIHDTVCDTSDAYPPLLRTTIKNHHPSPLPPSVTSDAMTDSDGRTENPSDSEPTGLSGVAAKARKRKTQQADLALACLPVEMRAINNRDLVEIETLLAELVDGGWRPDQIKARLAAKALPTPVRSMAGLVAHRLGELDPNLPPSPPPCPTAEIEDEPEPDLEPEPADPVAAEILANGGPRALIDYYRHNTLSHKMTQNGPVRPLEAQTGPNPGESTPATSKAARRRKSARR